MYKEFSLNIDELAMRNPSDDLVHEDFLAFFQHYFCPIPHPQASLLECLPEDVDDDSPSVLFVYYLLDQVPYIFHYEQVFCDLGFDVAKGEVFALSEVALE